MMFDKVRLKINVFEYDSRLENFIFVMYMSVFLNKYEIIMKNMNIKFEIVKVSLWFF